jgi:hypothetical protein
MAKLRVLEDGNGGLTLLEHGQGVRSAQLSISLTAPSQKFRRVKGTHHLPTAPRDSPISCSILLGLQEGDLRWTPLKATRHSTSSPSIPR